jgi:site-specific DNA-adenine methylase
MKAPFPWFGGKSLCASEVWAALGDVDNYVEPFAGSLAVLLARPHTPRVETVNDLDHYLANFWRALARDPQAVAHHANNPVNEADLTARHLWLVNTGRERIARILGDPDYYDAQVAGWWVWGLCCWIGSGWCSGVGPWHSVDGALVRDGDGAGVNRQLVHLGDAGQGVNRKRVQLGSAGQGVNRKRVQLASGGGRGIGVNRLSVHGDAQPAGTETGEDELAAYLSELAARLRYVRVCCGEWQRVVTDGALSTGATVGVFLDPPYDTDLRDGDLYNSDGEHGHVSAAVREWALANGDNHRYRIVLAGYAEEHALPGWRQVRYTARRAYGTSNGESANNHNRTQETLWLSPGCLGGEVRQAGLFDGID